MEICMCYQFLNGGSEVIEMQIFPLGEGGWLK